MRNETPFIIWAPSFNASIGGHIALHYLCHLINNLGYRAYIWPAARWPKFNIGQISDNRSIEIIQRVLRLGKSKIKRDTYYLHPNFQTPVASKENLRGAIVVYPEIVDGNPLGSEKVVRWLLHKPGFFTGVVNLGENELCFYYQEFFKDQKSNEKTDNILRVRWIRDDIYSQHNFGTRHGSCYLIRKGADRSDIKRPKGAVRIDYMGHRRVARTFNQKKYFYTYDPYTMYCVYAVICGCIPVVIPQESISKEQWRPNPADRYGIAYGIDDIQWAQETRANLISRIYEEKKKEKEMVLSFIDKCFDFFVI